MVIMAVIVFVYATDIPLRMMTIVTSLRLENGRFARVT